MAWTAPASFTVGEIVTSTKLNTHLRDNLKAMAPVHYSEITANVNLSGTAYTAPTDVIAGEAVTYEARPVLVEFYCPRLERNGAASTVYVGVYDDTTHVATIVQYSDGNTGHGQQVWAAHRFTPTAASHTYNVKAWGDGAGGTVYAGAGGGSGALAPAFLRIRYDEF